MLVSAKRRERLALNFGPSKHTLTKTSLVGFVIIQRSYLHGTGEKL